MGNFRRNDRRSSGGGFSRGNKSFGGRDAGRPSMHSAICNDCGDDCQVPFKPTGDKPIYCSNCFGKHGGGKPNKFGGDRRDRGNFGRDRQMHKAVCAKCGDDCQVPFRPTSSKPVYCDNCFEKGNNTGRGSAQQSNEQLIEINAKLDLIMTALGLSKDKKEKVKKGEKNKKAETKKKVAKKTPIKATKKTVKKESKPKKKATKKTKTKKTVAKKKSSAKKKTTKKKATAKKK